MQITMFIKFLKVSKIDVHAYTPTHKSKTNCTAIYIYIYIYIYRHASI